MSKKVINKADLLHYKAIIKAIELNMVKVNVSFLKMNKPNSPVYNAWENLIPILTPVFIGLTIMVTASLIEGLIFLILGILLYLYFFRIIIANRIKERTLEIIKKDYYSWEKIWDYGGISISSTLNPKIGCKAPDDDWKKFVALNLSELMVDEEKQQSKKPKINLNEGKQNPYIAKEQPNFRHPDIQKDAKKSYIDEEPDPKDVFNLDGIIDTNKND